MSPGRSIERVEAPVAQPPAVSYYLRGWAVYFIEYTPGLALLTLLAVMARGLGQGSSDSYYVLYAILLGIVVRNAFGLSPLFEPGTRTYEVFWKAGIVLLGSQMALHSFRGVGFKGLGLAGSEVLLVVTATVLLAKALRIPPPLRYLLAIGMGICGVSAVIALATTLRSDEEDTGYAVSVILLFGLAALSLMPILGHWLHLSDFHFGLWAGLSVNNTAEAVATGFLYSEASGHYATIAKLCRNIYLDAALLFFVHRMVREKFVLTATSNLKAIWQHFPKFAIGLVVFSGLATVQFWSPEAVVELNHLYRWAFLLGFAGVGLRTDFKRLRRRGLGPLVLGFSIQAMTVAVMLGCVLLAF